MTGAEGGPLAVDAGPVTPERKLELARWIAFQLAQGVAAQDAEIVDRPTDREATASFAAAFATPIEAEVVSVPAPHASGEAGGHVIPRRFHDGAGRGYPATANEGCDFEGRHSSRHRLRSHGAL